MQDAPPQIILFDLGRVIVDWEPDRLYANLIPDAAERDYFLNNICTLDWHKNHDRGVPFAQNAAPLIKKFPKYEALIKAWHEAWRDMFDGYIRGMDVLLDRLRAKNIPLYALTNLPSWAWPLLQADYMRLAHFKDVIVSGDEKCIKPDPEIYQIALSRMGHPDPSSVLFIDDTRANITAAKALGFCGHHFKSADMLETELIARKIL